MSRHKEPAIPNELLDQLLAGDDAGTALAQGGLLDAHLTSDDGASARQTIRPLIERIVVQPGSARGGKRRSIQLYGDLYRMLAFAEGACAPNAQQARLLRDGPVVIPLVAGTAPIGNLQVS